MTATIESTAPATLDTDPALVYETTAIVAAADLLRAVKTVKGALANKTTLPVLNNILLYSPGEGALDVTATDLGVGITVHTDALVFDPFAMTVPGKLLLDTLPKSGDLILTTNHHTNTLLTEEPDGTQTRYNGISPDEYPIIPRNVGWTLAAVLPNALVQRAVKEVAPFASTDGSRPQMCGVWMSLSDSGGITLAAADGFRLGKLTGRVAEDSPAPAAASYIIPARSVAQLAVLADQGEAVQMFAHSRHSTMLFTAGNVEVTTRLIEGTYVDINRVIPDNWATRTIVPVDDLAAALKKIGAFTKDSANILRFDFAPHKYDVLYPGTLTLSGNAAELGSRTRKMEVTLLGEPGQVALNLRFVQDLIAPYKGQQIAIQTKTYQSPVTFEVVGDPDFLAVLMPMYLPNR